VGEAGFGGIAVSVINPEGRPKRCWRISKKIPLITMDNDAEKSGRPLLRRHRQYEGGKPSAGW